MITAQVRKTEKEYRKIECDSSSTLKEFLLDRKLYYKKYVINEPVEEETSKSSIIGSLVHCLLLEPDTFGDKYYESSCPETPTEKMLEFTLALYSITMENVDSNGVVKMDFSNMAQLALNKAPIGNWKLDTVLKKWSEANGETYYRELIQSKPKGLTVISEKDMEIAEGIVSTLKMDEFSDSIVNQNTTDSITVYNELQLEGPEYIIYGHPMKGMIDKLIIDHKAKKIMPWDLKVTWEPNRFYEAYYLPRRSYIQAYIYYKLVEIWADGNGYNHYDLDFPKFLVCDSTNFYRPLKYVLSAEDMTGANSGFSHRGKYYPGVQEIITDLKWAIDKGEWKMSRQDFVNGGVCKFR
jgi:hypothetical protein